MNKAFELFTIPCVLHPSESIIRINGGLNSTKQLYCCQCVLEDVIPKQTNAPLIKIGEFLNEAAGFYTTERNTFAFPSVSTSPPSECLETLSRKNQNLTILKDHIETEKKKIECIFDEITQVMITKINKKKSEYLDNLDIQYIKACQNYNTFEKLLKRNYPKLEDLDVLFP